MNSQQAATLLPHAFRVTPAASRPNAEPLGGRSLREIVESAIAKAESQAIRRALALARGNKSHAARMLRTNYTDPARKDEAFRNLGPRVPLSLTPSPAANTPSLHRW